jgi:hypothetical protein
MRTSFELEYEVDDYYEAQLEASMKIAKFLKITVPEVDDKVSIELKVKDAETEGKYLVTAHAQLKNNSIHTPRI